MASNRFEVPAKMWQGWSPAARDVFDRTYGFLMDNRTRVTHPKAAEIPPEHWKTIAWNAACAAAVAAMGATLKVRA